MKLVSFLKTALAAVALFAATTTVHASFVGTFAGNDCSGVFGQGFSDCSYNGSPVIAKFDVNEQGTSGVWTINKKYFPSITGEEWSFGFGSTGTWSYTPGAGDPLITFYVAKGGNFFNLFSNDGDVNSGDWFTPINENGNGKGIKRYGLSHLTFYDTGRPTTQVPEPISLALLGIGLLGVGAVRRIKKA